MSEPHTSEPFNAGATGRTSEERKSIIKSFLAREPSELSRQAICDIVLSGPVYEQSHLAAFLYKYSIDDRMMRNFAQGVMIENILQRPVNESGEKAPRFRFAIWTAGELPQKSSFREHVMAMAFDALPDTPFARIDSGITLWKESKDDSTIKKMAEKTVIDTLDKNLFMASDRDTVGSYHSLVQRVINNTPAEAAMNRYALATKDAMASFDAYKEWQEQFRTQSLPHFNI